MGNENRSELDELVSMVAAFEDGSEFTDKESNTLNRVLKELGATPKLTMIKAIVQHYTDIYNALLQKDIPLSLASSGLKEGKTLDGIKVKVVSVISTKTLDMEKASEWCARTGNGGIVKDTLELAKGAFTPAVAAFFSKNHIDYAKKASINGQSLKKAISEAMEHGQSLPPADAVEVKVFNEAKITYPKAVF